MRRKRLMGLLHPALTFTSPPVSSGYGATYGQNYGA